MGLGYRSAAWLADLGLYQYIELFKRLDLTPDNLFYRLRKPGDLKEIGIGTEYRDAVMNKIRDDHQQLLLDDKFHQVILSLSIVFMSRSNCLVLAIVFC